MSTRPGGFGQEVVRLLPYGAMLMLSVGLVVLRVDRTGSGMYAFLVWNLFLAALPLGASTALRLADGAGVRRLLLMPLLGLWLLFLPNAPYILTDLLHLNPRPPVPMWYDLMLLLTAAGTGLALGYRSLLDVEAVVSRWYGRTAALATSVVVLFLSGFGVYLGRFVRLNSWDVIAEPTWLLGVIADRLLDPTAHLPTWAFTALFGLLLSLGYAALRPRPEPRHVS